MSGNKPGRGSDQFPLRLPDGMRDRIKSEADKNGRSMNAEIVARLEDYPAAQKLLAATMQERSQLAIDNERLESELGRLEDLRRRFFNNEGNPEPVLAIPQPLMDRIKLQAERNHRTIDAEAITALEIAFPPKSIDVDALSAFLESLIGVSAPDGDKEYLDQINDALARAKQPWTVRAGWDGEIRFYPYATQNPSEHPNREGDEK